MESKRNRGRVLKDFGKIMYKVIDAKGKTIETFRYLQNARAFKLKHEDLTGDELEIEYL